MASIKTDAMKKPKTGDKKGETEVPMEQLLKLDAIQVELGYALVHLADQSKKGDLLSRFCEGYGSSYSSYQSKR